MKKKSKMIILSILLIFFFSSIFVNNIFYTELIVENRLKSNENGKIKFAAYWDLTGTPISIDGDSEWATTASSQPWCSGSGTITDPYTIENVTIDGQNSSSCIDIRNSNVYFKIKNCILYNSMYTAFGAGIKIQNAGNGALEENNISINNGYGISLDNSHDINLTGNIFENNGRYNIFLDASSYNNLMFSNFIIGNPPLAYDDGTNFWDNGSIGNYWSDYDYRDLDDDGIGDRSYENIQGVAASIDNYPIWDDGIDVNNDPEVLNYGTFHLPEYFLVNNFDPHYRSDNYILKVTSQIFETLFTYNLSSRQNRIIPKLALSMGTWSADKLNYTVELRQNIKFHDGTPFNASTVKWSIDRLHYFMNTSGTLPSNTTLNQFTSVYFWNDNTPIINRTAVIDDYMIRFVLNKPFAAFEGLLCFEGSVILSPSSTPFYRYLDFNTDDLIGTGPFEYLEYIQDDRVRLIAFKDYWVEAPDIKYVNIIRIQSMADRQKFMSLGVIDFLDRVGIISSWDPLDTSMLNSFKNISNINLIGPENSSDFIYLGMNNTLLDKTWRKAISYATNYSYIINEIAEGHANRLRSPIPYGMLYSNYSNQIATCNITKARETMQSMGFGVGWDTDYPGTDEGLWTSTIFASLDYSYLDSSPIFANIYNSWSYSLNLIGIEVIDDPLSWFDFYMRLYYNVGTLELFGYYYEGITYNDPSVLLEYLYSNSSIYNRGQVNDTVLEGLMEQALNETDFSIRKSLYNNMQKYIVEDLYPYVYIYTPHMYYAIRNDFRYKPNFMGKIWFNDIHSIYREPIEIDGVASGVGAHNWTWARNQPWWRTLIEGSGTSNDPYIFNGLIFNGQDLNSCIEIKNSNKYIIFNNCKIYNSSSIAGSAGIKLVNVSNVAIINSNCSFNNGIGILLENCENNTIKTTFINNNFEYGIYLESSNNTEIYGNIINENSIKCFEDNNGLNNNFTWNVCNYTISPIIIDETGSGNFTWSKASSDLLWCSGSGTLTDPYLLKNLIINGNNISNCIKISNSIVQFLIQDCKFLNASDSGSGIIFNNVTYGVLENSTISDNNYLGISIDSGLNISLIENMITNNQYYGVFIENSNHTSIQKNTIVFNPFGSITIRFCINTTFSNNTVSNNPSGVEFYYCQYSYIYEQMIYNNTNTGLYLGDCDLSFIYNNTIKYNYDGISIHRSNNSVVSLNYVQFHKGSCIELNGFLESCNNNNISNNTISNSNNYGIILLYNCYNNNISNNKISNNYQGIYCSGNDIRFNCIFENIIKNNTNQGIFFQGTLINNNTIKSNVLIENFRGIELEYGNSNNLTNNVLINNTQRGLYLQSDASYNLISQNYFYTNALNAYDDGYKNKWNTSTIGNYWSDYSGKDVDDDGIGDVPYLNIGGTAPSQDKLPIWWDPIVFSVISPTENEIFQQTPPNYTIIIEEGISHTMWYTLGNDTSIYTFTTNGTINFSAWDSMANGTVLIRFYVNDSRGVETAHEINVRKDTLGPLITIHNPIYNQAFSYKAPNYNISIIDSNFHNAWYVVSNKSYSSANMNITIWSGTINQTIWDIFPDGSVNITFYANDTFANMGFAEVNILKDTHVPMISINSPHPGDRFDTISPSFNITITELNPDYIWYTIDDGITNKTTTSTGIIDEEEWNKKGRETITIIFYANDTAGNIGYQSVSIEKYYNYWPLNPLIIDDSGSGDYTWMEAVKQGWCSGSGTKTDPFIIESLEIDGQSTGSCITISNSNISFTINNCSFYSSGNDQNDAGVKLINLSYGVLIYLNCSFNNGNGILLDSCQYVNITSSTINSNDLNGIKLINSNHINIFNNSDTINLNVENGIYLINSHNNKITDNVISNNGVGIYLDQSNYNNINGNNLSDNGTDIIIHNSVGNTGNNIPSPSGFPTEIFIIVLVIAIVAVGVTGAAILIKKRMTVSGLKKKEISEKKKEKMRTKLEGKLDFVDYLIKERNIKLAYKNLGKIQDTAETYEFFDIFNNANEKIEQCKDIESGILREIKREPVAKPAVKEKLKEEKKPTPTIEKEMEQASKTASKVEEGPKVVPTVVKPRKFNIFISYSSLDLDHFHINKIVEGLEKYPEIDKVYYYIKDSGQNIVEFMEKTLSISNTFVLFCTKHSKDSKSVEGEWQAAYQLNKKGAVKIIPVYENEEDVPILLMPFLNVRYTEDDLDGFIQRLYEEILR
ncbi:MAG: NosD domain-containing protein [Promethearchaeota archaeon]